MEVMDVDNPEASTSASSATGPVEGSSTANDKPPQAAVVKSDANSPWFVYFASRPIEPLFNSDVIINCFVFTQD